MKTIIKLNGKKCRRKNWCSVHPKRLGPKAWKIVLDTALKRPDIVCTSSGAVMTDKGRSRHIEGPSLHYQAGEDSYIRGKKVDYGSHDTEVAFVGMRGWRITLCQRDGRYSIALLLETLE